MPHEVRLAAGLALLGSQGVDPAGGPARAFTSTARKTADAAWEVRLKHVRTGREHAYRVALLEKEIEVALAESAMGSPLAWRLVEGDLWDRHRALIRQARLERLVGQVLSEQQRNAIASGAMTLVEVTRAVLMESAGSRTRESVTRSLQAIDLLSMLNEAIPFDAQTAFARAMKHPGPDLPEEIRTLAMRLGFDQSEI
jgi:hypothetical protein